MTWRIKNPISNIKHNNKVKVNEIADSSETMIQCQHDKTVSELFEECVKNYSDHVAVCFGREQLTYRELNVKANALANYLRQCGVGPNVIIALYLERSIEFIVGMLAIVKAGAAYLPLDIDQPVKRIKIILQDSQSAYILTNSHLSSDLFEVNPNIKIDLLKLDIFFQENKEINDCNPTPINSASDLIHIIYTSGSTGIPKGCMIIHNAVVNLVKNTNCIVFTPLDRVAQIANPAFDAMTFEVWGALLNGASLYIVPKSKLLLPLDFAGSLKENNITILIITVALLNLIVKNNQDSFDNLKYLMFCGEKANPEIIKILLERKERHNLSALNLLNGYGPAECTACTTAFKVASKQNIDKDVPIGNPISNVQTYILDEQLSFVSPGTIAELYIGGKGLALGYLNNPKQTAEKFIKAPWDAKEIIYKTGDLVYYDPVVGIVFVDRMDAQAKIRGFRVELTEIEACIIKYLGVSQVSVVMENNYLTAYVSFYQNSNIDFSMFYQYLKENLPSYMLPTKIIQLESVPLNANGKIDKQLLTNLKGINVLSFLSQEKPINSTEKAIVTILSDILHVPSVSTAQNFFEIGVNSLMVAEICVELNSKINSTNEITVSDIFKYHTVQLLAQHIENQKPTKVLILDDIINRANKKRKKFVSRKEHHGSS